MKLGSSSLGFLILFNLERRWTSISDERFTVALLLLGLRDFLQRRFNEFAFDIVEFDGQFVDLEEREREVGGMREGGDLHRSLVYEF